MIFCSRSPNRLKTVDYVYDHLYCVNSLNLCIFCSDAKLCLTLRPHGLQHTRLPCPSLSPGLCSNSCSLNWWCQPIISWWPKYWSLSFTSVLPMNIQGWFPLEWTGWISLLSKGLSRVFSNTTVWKHQFFGAQPSSWSNSHPYMTTGKTTALTIRAFVGKVVSLLFNLLIYSNLKNH